MAKQFQVETMFVEITEIDDASCALKGVWFVLSCSRITELGECLYSERCSKQRLLRRRYVGAAKCGRGHHSYRLSIYGVIHMLCVQPCDRSMSENSSYRKQIIKI